VIKLYYYPSYISLVPHILLEELGAPYELIFVDRYAGAHKRAEYLALNPNGLIPVLVDGPLVVYEAGAICLHLSDNHPQASLMPPLGSAEWAHAYKWLLWLATGLRPALSNYLHPGKWALTEAAQGELRTGAEAAVARHFDILDLCLAEQSGPWLTGADYSIADAYALALCRWSRKMERPGTSWPHVGPYARRVLERPAVQRALAQEHLTQPWI
jgi:glutathione S-transferase